jgi:hypothetical protein
LFICYKMGSKSRFVFTQNILLMARDDFGTFFRREILKSYKILFLNTGLRIVARHYRPAQSNEIVSLPKYQVVRSYK